MNKLYPYLHTTYNNLKKQLLPAGLLFFLSFLFSIRADAQCPVAPVVTPNPAFICLGDPPLKLKVTPTSVPIQLCSGPINIPVPDNNPAGASNSINVSGIPAGCSISTMSVTINMPHSRIGDMVFVLRSPSGQVLNLDYHLTVTGGNGLTTGFVNTVISSVGTIPLSAGTNPYSTTFRADAQISPGVGFGNAGPTGIQPTTVIWASLYAIPNGNWTLGFYDGVTGETGILSSWCLGITYTCGVPASPSVWSPMTGLFNDAAATIPYVGNIVDSVWVHPNQPGTYTYQVTRQGLPTTQVSFTNPSTISIPVGGTAITYPANLNVGGLPTAGMKVKSVILHGLNHTKSEDLDILLQSPTGQNVLLMSDAGGNNAANNVTYAFDDAGVPMNPLSVNATGIYRPTNSGVPDNFLAPGPGTFTQPTPLLGMFTGNFNGTWRLFIMDDDGTAGLGIISQGYTIIFEDIPCTSPPTAVVVTVGAPAVITAQPVDQTVCLGNPAIFSVTATGGSNYFWQVSTTGGGGPWANLLNGGPYSGVLTASLTINAPPLTMSGLYYRVVINGAGSCGALSNGALLTVYQSAAVSITASPDEINPGEETTIFSSVSPNPAATYTWFHDGNIIPGANADTLLIDFSGLGEYQLSVTDIGGCSGLSNILEIKDAPGRPTADLWLYPNPTGGQFQVKQYTELNTVNQLTLSIYNNMGVRVMTKAWKQTIPYERIDVDIRKHGKGMYWIEVKDANGKRIGMSRVLVE